MTEQERNKKYPPLTLRFKRAEFDYLRREASERGLKLHAYARRILIPFQISDGKNNFK